MRDNYHQKQEMIRLALSLGSKWRFGISFIHLSLQQNRNPHILQQRLSPEQVADIIDPGIKQESSNDRNSARTACGYWTDETLFIASVPRTWIHSILTLTADWVFVL